VQDHQQQFVGGTQRPGSNALEGEALRCPELGIGVVVAPEPQGMPVDVELPAGGVLEVGAAPDAKRPLIGHEPDGDVLDWAHAAIGEYLTRAGDGAGGDEDVDVRHLADPGVMASLSHASGRYEYQGRRPGLLEVGDDGHHLGLNAVVHIRDAQGGPDALPGGDPALVTHQGCAQQI
jgi:hypothetical protein